jgi:hypothetical protein
MRFSVRYRLHAPSFRLSVAFLVLFAACALEGRHFGDALLERPLDLSPTNHSQVVVPVRFEWAGVGAGAKALLRRQAIAYGVTGAVLVETPLGARRVTVRGEGDVPLRALAR